MTPTARYTIVLAMTNLAIYLGIFVCWIFSGDNPQTADNLSGLLALPPSLSGLLLKPWTIATFMFTQVGFMHLIANMLWLIGFGGMMKAGPRGLLFTYFAGGIGGGIAFLIYGALASTQLAPLIGASASVIAVVMTTTILTPNRRVGLLWFWEIKLKWLAPIALLTIFGGTPGAVCAHLGGAAAGASCGLVIRFLNKRRSRLSLLKARREFDRLKRDAHRSAIIAKASNSGFAALSESERLEVFNLSRPAAGE